MGQALSTCNLGCLENALGLEDKEQLLRLESLKRGQKFMRSTLLGLSQREIYVNLSDDTSLVQWKCPQSTFSSEERGEIDLTLIKTVKLSGLSTLQFISDNGTATFEITSEDPKIRDMWVLSLNEIIQHWSMHPETKPRAKLTAAGTTNKAEYFAKRQEEMAEREKHAREAKAKYLTGGMKYTAIAMASRP